MSASLVIGIDLGGTQLRLAVVAPDGRLVTEVFTTSTSIGFTPDDLAHALQKMWSQVKAVVPTDDIRACGIGITGIVRRQRLAASDFLPRLVNCDLVKLISAALDGLPITIENDARCFLLAEARFGAGRGARHACGITLGTGLGGAVLANNVLLTGVNAEAGEIWRIPCRGQVLEYFLSSAGLVRGYVAAGGQAEVTLAAVEIAARARGGEAAALSAWAAYGEDVYFLCETMIALLEPEVIVLGGSMAQAHDLFGAQFKEKLAERSTRIALAELGPVAGLIGAAALHF